MSGKVLCWGGDEMASKEIALTGELHMSSTGYYMTVNAVEALKIIGLAYGLYDHAEEFRECRVTLQNGERPVLAVQEDRSLQGSPCWVTVRAVTDDPEQIRRYLSFRETLKMVKQMELAQEKGPDRQGLAQSSWKKKGGKYA